MKPKAKTKQQRYVVVKHVLATSVEEAIKKQNQFPVIYCNIEVAEQPEPVQVGFTTK